MSYRLLRFKVCPEIDTKRFYWTVYVLKNKQAMYKFYRKMHELSKDPKPLGELKFEAVHTGYARADSPNELGSILFYEKSANSPRVVAHEMMHALIYYYRLHKPYDWLSALNRSETEEALCSLLDSLVLQFTNNWYEDMPF